MEFPEEVPGASGGGAATVRGGAERFRKKTGAFGGVAERFRKKTGAFGGVAARFRKKRRDVPERELAAPEGEQGGSGMGVGNVPREVP
jgi:hypothetical protein